MAAAAVLAAGTGSAATASAAAATGNRCSFDTASRTLDLAITSADDGASTLIVVRPDGVIEPRFESVERADRGRPRQR